MALVRLLTTTLLGIPALAGNDVAEAREADPMLPSADVVASFAEGASLVGLKYPCQVCNAVINIRN